MTELEKITCAKTYVDKLANGINLLTNQPVSDADSINDVRISRCLFYVADILRQIVENGGISQGKTRIGVKCCLRFSNHYLAQNHINQIYLPDERAYIHSEHV